jgi:hypothetical protein
MKIFSNSEEWSLNNKNNTGLPRPYFNVPKKFYSISKKYLAKKIPIPYQSMAGEDDLVIRLDIKNEKYVVENDLCPYCGVFINPKENSIRWMIEKETDLREEKDLVPSDFHPFHLECMKQARTYCPFMRTLKDDVFDIKEQEINLGIAKENYKKYFTINWQNKNRDYINDL